MRHDFYAEFWKYLKKEFDERFEKYAKKTWEDIEDSQRPRRRDKKIKEFVRKLNGSHALQHEVVSEFLGCEKDISILPLYAKLQKMLQHYVGVNREKLVDVAQKVVGDVRGRTKGMIGKLDLGEASKTAYREFVREIRNDRDDKYGDDILSFLKKLYPSYDSSGRHMINIEIKFKLKRPYISRDDEEFYIIDNPVCKEKVFKVSYIRPTSWKGVLRHVVRDILRKRREVVEKRLFGNEKGEEKSRCGRLFFLPTFLSGISLDVITPLDRVRRAPAHGPILFEVAPEGTEGVFKLIYMPFDLHEKLFSEREMDKLEALREIREDLEVLKEAIPKMMLEHGFSAKRSSGYGVVENRIEFWINGEHFKGTFDDFKKEVQRKINEMGDRNEHL
ncbi:MAG TPA: hypothetical protein ENG16_00295 [Archaeoglobus sp.]|nr:hypothetical protein [Archaeoglobus sp.]